MKTAMQLAKDWVNVELIPDLYWGFSTEKEAEIELKLQEFLSYEKEQIIEAFKAGFRDGRKYFEMEEKYESAEDYYGKNFKTKLK